MCCFEVTTKGWLGWASQNNSMIKNIKYMCSASDIINEIEKNGIQVSVNEISKINMRQTF